MGTHNSTKPKVLHIKVPRTPVQRSAEALTQAAQRELAPPRTPEPREADARAIETKHGSSLAALNEARLNQLMDSLGDPYAPIAALEARIDAQNAWNGNQTREISRLAERVAKLERALARLGKGWREERRRITRLEGAVEGPAEDQAPPGSGIGFLDTAAEHAFPWTWWNTEEREAELDQIRKEDDCE